MAKDLQTSAFVKKLAANDLPTRKKALESLQKFLKSPRNLSLLEYEKLWKGLYYSMWFCDRPRPQQRLALELGKLFEIIPLENFQNFQKAWWIIITKEWVSIDHWRLDKFLMLIRFVLNSLFKRLAEEDWDSEIVEQFLNTLQEVPLSGDKTIPNGIPFHIIDIYVDELEKVLFKELEDDKEDDEEENDDEAEKLEIVNQSPISELIQPFIKLSQTSNYKTLREKIKNELLSDERLINWGVLNKKNKEPKKDEDEEEESESESEEEWNGFE